MNANRATTNRYDNWGESEKENDTIVTPSAKYWLGEDGIIRGVITSTEEHTLQFAKENSEVVKKISCDKGRPLFMDIRNCKSIAHDARTHYARSEAGKNLTACGILIGSPVGRMIGNFFLRINKPIYPTKLFNSENEAIEWLRRYIE